MKDYTVDHLIIATSEPSHLMLNINIRLCCMKAENSKW